MLYFAEGGPQTRLSEDQLRAAIISLIDQFPEARRVLAIPPDMSRFHSQAGLLTRFVYDRLGPRLAAVLPAIGTHTPMTPEQLDHMFPGVPRDLFRDHNWKQDLTTLGTVPEDFVHEISEGKLRFPWPAQVNRLLTHGAMDLILSIGQVVPHEVIGMANYNKNIFVGTGGRDAINKSHYLGAIYGMERIMGRADSPVRALLNYASREFARQLPVIYVLTVVGKDPDGSLAVRGLFIGDDDECFYRASQLASLVNLTRVDHGLKKVVAYMDPHEYHSTWIGNKSIYRTRMAIADGGELVVLAPGVREFGEDAENDRLIRKYGYVGVQEVLSLVADNPELASSLGAAAHLVHGAPEGRFTVTYCPGRLTRQEIETVGFQYGDYAEMSRQYDPETLKDGVNILPDGEEIFYISNPALGLWVRRELFPE
jgi:nickel-dependent lactate racemase